MSFRASSHVRPMLPVDGDEPVRRDEQRRAHSHRRPACGSAIGCTGGDRRPLPRRPATVWLPARRRGSAPEPRQGCSWTADSPARTRRDACSGDPVDLRGVHRGHRRNGGHRSRTHASTASPLLPRTILRAIHTARVVEVHGRSPQSAPSLRESFPRHTGHQVIGGEWSLIDR